MLTDEQEQRRETLRRQTRKDDMQVFYRVDLLVQLPNLCKHSYEVDKLVIFDHKILSIRQNASRNTQLSCMLNLRPCLFLLFITVRY